MGIAVRIAVAFGCLFIVAGVASWSLPGAAIAAGVSCFLYAALFLIDV